MTKQTSPDDPTLPNPASNKEPAEGSRETTGDISNRPMDEERDDPKHSRNRQEDPGASDA